MGWKVERRTEEAHGAVALSECRGRRASPGCPWGRPTFESLFVRCGAWRWDGGGGGGGGGDGWRQRPLRQRWQQRVDGMIKSSKLLCDD